MNKKKTHYDTSKKRTSEKWCPCGFKKHGRNHEEGIHHKDGKKQT